MAVLGGVHNVVLASTEESSVRHGIATVMVNILRNAVAVNALSFFGG